LKVGRTLLIWLKTHRIGDSPPIRELPIFFFSSPFSSIFSLKPWKLRGKVVSLQKKSCTRQIENKLSLRSFAFSLQKKSCTRQIENKLSLRSFAFSSSQNPYAFC
jgi:hypothetical protein